MSAMGLEWTSPVRQGRALLAHALIAFDNPESLRDASSGAVRSGQVLVTASSEA